MLWRPPLDSSHLVELASPICRGWFAVLQGVVRRSAGFGSPFCTQGALGVGVGLGVGVELFPGPKLGSGLVESDPTKTNETTPQSGGSGVAGVGLGVGVELAVAVVGDYCEG